MHKALRRELLADTTNELCMQLNVMMVKGGCSQDIGLQLAVVVVDGWIEEKR